MADHQRDDAGGRPLTQQVFLDDLIQANRPRQLGLIERAANTLSMGSAVTHLSVRGSLATGTADRMSDIDFVVGVRDAAFRPFIEALDALMVTELGALLPGWRDTIVGEMGGLGYVYLVVSNGKLHQIDLYVVPASRVVEVQRQTNARIIYESSSGIDAAPDTEELTDFIDRHTSRSASRTELFVEMLVLIQMMSKRISRGQRFLIYDETHLLLTSLKNLIKVALAPTSKHWGWYHLEEDVGVSDTGRKCLACLSELVACSPLRTHEELRRSAHQVFHTVRLATPETIDPLGPAVDAYLHYLDLT